jgi:cation:H+ antiporter
MTLLVLQFLICAAVVIWSGGRLARYGEPIAECTGLGSTWIGLLLMAAVTSLPELITGASAVALFGAADIAAGDALGSCMFNLVILALLAGCTRASPSVGLHPGHVLSAAFGIVQLGLVLLALAAGAVAPVLGWVGLHSLLFLGVWVLAMRVLLQFERRRTVESSTQLAAAVPWDPARKRRLFTLYAATAALLVAAAVVLPGLAEELARRTGLSQSLVGGLFVAAITSLPEVAVSWAAARVGALDMAAANLLGSNIFNVAILGLNDFLYTDGSLLVAVSPVHGATAATALTMTAVSIIALSAGASPKRRGFGWDSWVNLSLYGTCIALLARLR